MFAHYGQTLRLFSRDVRCLLVTSVLIGIAYFGIFTLLLNLFLLRLGYDAAFIGVVNAVGPLAMAIGGLPAGMLSRRWGSRYALLLGLCLITLSFVLLPIGEFLPARGQAGWFLATYTLLWVGATFYLVNTSPFLMGATVGPERTHAFAMHSALIALAGFIGNLIGGLLPGWFAGFLGVTVTAPAPYRYTLWLAAVILLPSVPVIGATRPSKGEQHQEQSSTTGAPPVMLILVLTILMLLRTSSEWVMRIFLNVYLDADLHLSTALIGVLGAGGQLLGIVALAGPLVMARWGKMRMIGWGYVAMAGAFLPLILIRHWAGAGLGFMGIVALTFLTNPVFSLFCQESVCPRWRTMVAGTTTVAFGGGWPLLPLAAAT